MWSLGPQGTGMTPGHGGSEETNDMREEREISFLISVFGDARTYKYYLVSFRGLFIGGIYRTCGAR